MMMDNTDANIDDSFITSIHAEHHDVTFADILVLDNSTDYEGIDRRHSNTLGVTPSLSATTATTTANSSSSVSTSYNLIPRVVPPVTRDDQIKLLASKYDEETLFDTACRLLGHDLSLLTLEQVEHIALHYEAISFIAMECGNRTVYTSQVYSILLELYAYINDWYHAIGIAKTYVYIYGETLVSSHCSLAFAYRKNKQLDEAIKAATEGLRLYPNAEILFSIRGKCYYDQKKYKKAVTDFDNSMLLARQAHNEKSCKVPLKCWIANKALPVDIMIKNSF